MQARLTDLNRNEILMYLGHRGQEITPQIQGQIERCVEQVCKKAQPRLVYRRLPVEQGQVKGFPMEGNDIRALLGECQEAVLMAVTLGAGVEQLLMRSEVTNLADAVIMDSCASVAVENVCDNFEADLRALLAGQGLYLTSRFSPGYGDLPLSLQPKFCEVLNTAKRIGLTVSANYLMVPRKSVTAVMGISDRPQALRARGCEVCSMFLDCPYRIRGKRCRG